MQSTFSRFLSHLKGTTIVNVKFRLLSSMAQFRSVSPLSRTPCDQLVRARVSSSICSTSSSSPFVRAVPSSSLLAAPSPASCGRPFSGGLVGSIRPRQDIVVTRATLPAAMAAGPHIHVKEQDQLGPPPGFLQQKSTASGRSRQMVRGVASTPVRHGSQAVQMMEPEISDASRSQGKFDPQLPVLGDFGRDSAAPLPVPYADEAQLVDSHVSLNLKYRPKNFKELVGQETIAKRLMNALDMNKKYGAYLFCGPRGTGKTSAARILATAMNCQDSRGFRPCGHCLMCKTSMKVHGGPIREIDGATNNGVETVKHLMENARYASSEPHKVYIIDECHMLSPEAAMQLVKAIEKPPKGVVFILVTTDEDKLPKAVVSACQKFNFKKIQPEAIAKRLRSHAALEKVQVEEEALKLIATLADGSLRDAEMMLERAVICGEDLITAASIEELEGRAPQQLIQELLESIRSVDQSPRVLEITTNLLDQGVSPITIVDQLAALVCQLVAACQPARKHPLAELAQRVGGSNALQKLQRELVSIEERVSRSSARDLWLKMNLCAMAETSADSTPMPPEPSPSLASISAEGDGVGEVASRLAPEPPQSPSLAGTEAPQPGAAPEAPEAVADAGSGPSEAAVGGMHVAPAAAEVGGEAAKEILEGGGDVTVTDEAAEVAGEERVPWEELCSAVSAKTVRALLSQKGQLVSLTREEAVIQFESDAHQLRAQQGEKGITAAFSQVLGRPIKVLFMSTGARGRKKTATAADSSSKGSSDSSASGESGGASEPVNMEDTETSSSYVQVQLSGDPADAKAGGGVGSWEERRVEGEREREVNEGTNSVEEAVGSVKDGGGAWINAGAEFKEKLDKKKKMVAPASSSGSVRAAAAARYDSQQERSGGVEALSGARSVGSMALPSTSRSSSSGAAAKEFMVKKNRYSAKELARRLERWIGR